MAVNADSGIFEGFKLNINVGVARFCNALRGMLRTIWLVPPTPPPPAPSSNDQMALHRTHSFDMVRTVPWTCSKTC